MPHTSHVASFGIVACHRRASLCSMSPLLCRRTHRNHKRLCIQMPNRACRSSWAQWVSQCSSHLKMACALDGSCSCKSSRCSSPRTPQPLKSVVGSLPWKPRVLQWGPYLRQQTAIHLKQEKSMHSGVITQASVVEAALGTQYTQA